MDSSPGEQDLARLPIRVRRTDYGEGAQDEERTVYCPLSQASVPLCQCLECPRNAHLPAEAGTDSHVACFLPKPAACQGQTGKLAEAFVRVPVREVMTREVTCLDGGLALEEAQRVLDEVHHHCAPVVEPDGSVAGMVALRDLLAGRGTWVERAPRVVEDVMRVDVVCVPESASLADAAALFDRTGLHVLPVVTGEGAVVGMVSLADVLRWVSSRARSEG